MDSCYLELFTVKCRTCNSSDTKFYVTSDNKLVFECNRCDELEEAETK